MTAYSDAYALTVSLCGRKAMQTDIDLQIKAAIRKGHRAGSFPRDVKTVSVGGLSTSVVIQTIDLSSYCPRLRQLKAVKPTAYQDIWYSDEDIGSLLDPDGFAKQDVYWQVGNTLNVRPANPQTSVDVYYLDLPDLSNLSSSTDWILVNHNELVAHWAAMAILTLLGETEARNGIKELAVEFYEDLIEESVEIIGR